MAAGAGAMLCPSCHSMYLARREWLEPRCCNWLDLAPICFEVFLSREPIRKHALLIAPLANAGRTYETTGPNVYTLRELVGITLRLIGRRRLLVPVPFAIAEFLARLFELLPSPPLTTGQVDLLKVDSVPSGTLPGLQDLNIQPKAVEEVVPTYIRRPHASNRAEPSIGP